MTGTTIYPTMTCFDDAVAIVGDLLRADISVEPEIRVVHAVCINPDTGAEFSHAWVEFRSEILFMGIVEGRRATIYAVFDGYYEHMQVQHFTRYTLREMMALERVTGQVGPWNDKYRRLCGDVKAAAD